MTADQGAAYKEASVSAAFVLAQVLVRVHLRPINPSDIMAIKGVYQGCALRQGLLSTGACLRRFCVLCCFFLISFAVSLLKPLRCKVYLCSNPTSTTKHLFCSFKPKAYPAVPGLEGMGTVFKNGPNASKFKVAQHTAPTLRPCVSGGNDDKTRPAAAHNPVACLHLAFRTAEVPATAVSHPRACSTLPHSLLDNCRRLLGRCS